MKVMISLASTSAKDRAEEAHKKQQHKVASLTDKLSEAKAKHKELRLKYLKLG